MKSLESNKSKKSILQSVNKKRVFRRKYTGAIVLVLVTFILVACNKSGDTRLLDIVPDKDYTDVISSRGNEDIISTWMNIIYADEEKVIAVANDGVLFVYDYEQNKVVRYISLRDYGINGSLEGDADVLKMLVDKNCRYIYINEWGLQDKNGNVEKVTFGKYRYDIDKNNVEEYEFEENEIIAWTSEAAKDAKNVMILGKTTNEVVYGVDIEETEEVLWKHNKEQIVIMKDGKAMKYFPFEPGREPESITIEY